MRRAQKNLSQGSPKAYFEQCFGRFISHDWKDQQGLLGEISKLLQRQSGGKNKEVAMGMGLSLLGYRLQDFIPCNRLPITIADSLPQLACTNLYQAAIRVKLVLEKGHIPWDHKILHNMTPLSNSILFTDAKVNNCKENILIKVMPLKEQKKWPKNSLLLINDKDWINAKHIKATENLADEFAKTVNLLLPQQDISLDIESQQLLWRFIQSQKAFSKACGHKLESVELIKTIALIHAVFAESRRLEVGTVSVSWALSYVLDLYKHFLQKKY